MVYAYAEVLEEILGLDVDLELTGLVVRGVKGRDLRNVLILALTLLLLKLEGDTADGTTLNTLHQVGSVAGNLLTSQSACLFCLDGCCVDTSSRGTRSRCAGSTAAVIPTRIIVLTSPDRVFPARSLVSRSS